MAYHLHAVQKLTVLLADETISAEDREAFEWQMGRHRRWLAARKVFAI